MLRREKRKKKSRRVGPLRARPQPEPTQVRASRKICGQFLRNAAENKAKQLQSSTTQEKAKEYPSWSECIEWEIHLSIENISKNESSR